MLSQPLQQQETAKFGTESLVAAEVDQLMEHVKYAFHHSISGKSKGINVPLKCSKQPQGSMERSMKIGLLWKNAEPYLSSKYISAVSQLKSLER